jgi:uncharacterized protein YjbJ (UPF0337 family)
MSTQTDARHSTSATESEGSTTAAQAKAQEVVGRAQDQAQAVAGQTQDRVREQVNQRSTQLGEQIGQHASDLRSVGEALREQGKNQPAQATDRLAGYAERAGSYLRDKDADSLLSDAEEFGRQKPAAVAAGALALGFLAARFLKASSSRRYAARELPQRSASSTEVSTGAAPVSQQAAATDQAFGAPARTGI